MFTIFRYSPMYVGKGVGTGRDGMGVCVPPTSPASAKNSIFPPTFPSGTENSETSWEELFARFHWPAPKAEGARYGGGKNRIFSEIPKPVLETFVIQVVGRLMLVPAASKL